MLNYALGILLAAALLWLIWWQARGKLAEIDLKQLWREGQKPYLIMALLLMPLNVMLEGGKWKMLAGSAQRLSYADAVKSVLGGIALSLITPNRIGEYPGRIVYLKRQNTVRLISVSFLGAFAQFITLFLAGLAGLIWYNISYPGMWQAIILSGTLTATIIIIFLYLKFESWSPYIERLKWLKRFGAYSQLLQRFTVTEELTVLLFSMCRFAVYTAQYLALMRWMNISLPWLDGAMLASLFFWAMAIIPSIALAELGVRGSVSLFLFGHVTSNSAGVLSATIMLWCINLIVPATLGCLLLLKLRLVKTNEPL